MFRRLVFIFMMFALPFQITWAAAGVFCEHETGSAARHFGHHDHVHKPTSADKSDLKGKLDPDCSFHSHAGCQGVVTNAEVVLVTGATNTFDVVSPQFHPHTVFYRPDRPKWVATV